jgi:hypothetical protein
MGCLGLCEVFRISVTFFFWGDLNRFQWQAWNCCQSRYLRLRKNCYESRRPHWTWGFPLQPVWLEDSPDQASRIIPEHYSSLIIPHCHGHVERTARQRNMVGVGITSNPALVNIQILGQWKSVDVRPQYIWDMRLMPALRGHSDLAFGISWWQILQRIAPHSNTGCHKNRRALCMPSYIVFCPYMYIPFLIVTAIRIGTIKQYISFFIWLSQCYNWFHRAAQSTSQSTTFMNLHDTWFFIGAACRHFHATLLCGTTPLRHNCESWRLGLCCRGAPRGSAPMLHCFNFEKVDGSNLLEVEEVSIDPIGALCFARVVWRSMASVLVFSQYIAVCRAFTCIWHFFAGPNNTDCASVISPKLCFGLGIPGISRYTCFGC